LATYFNQTTKRKRTTQTSSKTCNGNALITEGLTPLFFLCKIIETFHNLWIKKNSS
jgi:hypothetical protein